MYSAIGAARFKVGKPRWGNFGGVTIPACKQASGVWKEEKGLARVLRLQTLLQHRTIHRAKKDEERKKGKDEEGRGGGVALALLLTGVVVIRLVPSSRRLPAPPGPATVAVVQHSIPAC